MIGQSKKYWSFLRWREYFATARKEHSICIYYYIYVNGTANWKIWVILSIHLSVNQKLKWDCKLKDGPPSLDVFVVLSTIC